MDISLNNFIEKLKLIIKNKNLTNEELFLLSSSYYTDDESLYNIVSYFSNNSSYKKNPPINISIKDIPTIRKAANSLYLKIITLEKE